MSKLQPNGGQQEYVQNAESDLRQQCRGKKGENPEDSARFFESLRTSQST